MDLSKRYVIHCKVGGRSAKAVQLMSQNGFKHVQNLKGGILAWSDKIDQSMPTY